MKKVLITLVLTMTILYGFSQTLKEGEPVKSKEYVVKHDSKGTDIEKNKTLTEDINSEPIMDVIPEEDLEKIRKEIENKDNLKVEEYKVEKEKLRIGNIQNNPEKEKLKIENIENIRVIDESNGQKN